MLVLRQRQVARYGLNGDLSTHGHRPRLQGPVYLPVGVHNRLNGAAPDESFHPHVGGYGADRFAAPGDDGMDPDGVLIPEGLAVEVNGAQGQGGRVEGVDAQVGRPPSVGSPPDELDHLGHRAVVGAAHA